LLYESGMRLQECLRFRVKDFDFGNHRIIVRSAKGANDRSTLLPETLIEPLQYQLKTIQLIHQKDQKEGYGETLLPFALSKKYPNAGKEWVWQVCRSCFSTVHRSGIGCGETPSSSSQRSAKGCPASCLESGIRQKSYTTHFQALLRDPFARSWLQYSHSSGTPRPQRCQDNYDLCACPQSRSKSCSQSTRQHKKLFAVH
jgi:hypothetical protein